jgi:hypothetical protein
MYCFQPSHTSFLSPHLFDKFTSMLLVILILHNKHFFLAKILSQRACRHAHVQPFRDSAQCMASTIWEKGSMFVCCDI